MGELSRVNTLSHLPPLSPIKILRVLVYLIHPQGIRLYLQKTRKIRGQEIWFYLVAQEMLIYPHASMKHISKTRRTILKRFFITPPDSHGIGSGR